MKIKHVRNSINANIKKNRMRLPLKYYSNIVNLEKYIMFAAQAENAEFL